jgi:nucleoside-diphosphate-sugar epimerase
MRVLVTGCAGFIGSHLTERLLSDGHDVVGIDSFVPYYPPEQKRRNLEASRTHDRFVFHQLDLRTDALDGVLDGVDVIVNEAAMPGLPRSWTDMELYVSCNLLALHRLLEAAVAAGVPRIVQASTSSVYGREAVGDERLPTRPISPYGITKLAAEHLLDAYRESHGLQSTILRYFSIYGPRQRPDMAYHIFIEAMRGGRPITVYGDGSQSRSSTYVSDCVDATVAALAGDGDGRVFNIGGGAVLTLSRAIEIIAAELGVTPRIDYRPARRGDQLHTAGDVTLAKETFGYAPRVLPEDGLARQVAWHRETLGDRAGSVAGA